MSEQIQDLELWAEQAKLAGEDVQMELLGFSFFGFWVGLWVEGLDFRFKGVGFRVLGFEVWIYGV